MVRHAEGGNTEQMVSHSAAGVCSTLREDVISGVSSVSTFCPAILQRLRPRAASVRIVIQADDGGDHRAELMGLVH